MVGVKGSILCGFLVTMSNLGDSVTNLNEETFQVAAKKPHQDLRATEREEKGSVRHHGSSGLGLGLEVCKISAESSRLKVTR